MSWAKRIAIIVCCAVLGFAVTTAAQMAWLARIIVAVGAGAIAAAAENFWVIDTEKLAGYEAVSTTGLRPSIAMTAGAFRATHLTGHTRARLIAVLTNHLAAHPDSALHTLGSTLTAALNPDAPLSTNQARVLLDILTKEGPHHADSTGQYR